MPTPIQFKTILFDLDGTLVDTEPAAAHAIGEAFKSWNIAVTPDDAAYITGRTWEKAFEYLFNKYPIPIPPQEAATFMIEQYRQAMREKLLLVEGGAAAVRSLAPHFPLGLVSGSHRQEIFHALDVLQVREHFKIILGAEDYEKSKPDPEGYLKAIQHLGSDPAHTLIFEDSAAGIASARAAGAWVVSISGTNHFKQDTSAAHFSIPDLQCVTADWVHSLGPKLRR